jgi:hypothetical protein
MTYSESLTDHPLKHKAKGDFKTKRKKDCQPPQSVPTPRENGFHPHLYVE